MLVYLRRSKTLVRSFKTTLNPTPLLISKPSRSSSSTSALADADDSFVESYSPFDSRNSLSRFSNVSSEKRFPAVDGLPTLFQSLNPQQPGNEVDRMAVGADPRVLRFVTCHGLARKGRLKELRAALRKIIEEEGLVIWCLFWLMHLFFILLLLFFFFFFCLFFFLEAVDEKCDICNSTT